MSRITENNAPMTDNLELGRTRARWLGLKSSTLGGYMANPVYSAHDVHRLLASATTLFAHADGNFGHEATHMDDKFAGLLIGQKPIVKPDTAEELLADLVKWAAPSSGLEITALVERTRQFLAGRGK